MKTLEMDKFIPGLNLPEQKNWSYMSGGEKQRVTIIRALMLGYEPKLLIMDEGTTGLDGGNKNIALGLIKKRFKNAVVVYVDHQPSNGFCDRVIHINPETKKLVIAEEQESITAHKEESIRI